MNSNNVITFVKRTESLNLEKDPEVGSVSIRSAYCDEMSNEIFGIVMRIIERSGHMNNVDTEDEGFFNELQPRLTMVKEALYSVFCILENVDYDLSVVFDNLFEPIGYSGDEFSTQLFVSVNNKYRDQLIEMTKKYVESKDNNG